MMIASGGMGEFRNDTQRSGKLDRSGEEVTEEQKFRSIKDSKLRARRYKAQNKITEN
jgi:hypothetical protein